MKNIKFVLKVISGGSFKKVKTVVDDVSLKTDKNKFFILVDMAICFILYGAGINDYNVFAFYNIKHKKRKTYVTRVKNKKIITLCNNPDYSYIFDNKNEFNKIFSKYLKRDHLDVAEITYKDFEKFIKNKEIIFAKPNSGDSGTGIEKLSKKSFKSTKDMFNYVTNKKKNFGVLEEAIVKHKDMSKLFPYSVNCIRVVTILQDNIPHVVYVIGKTGGNNNFVDNTSKGGVFFPIDMKTGKIDGPARTSKLNFYDIHPYSKIKLKGYQIPYIDEVIKMAKEAALEVPEIGFVGWDIAICKDGPCIIEGNDFPGYDFWQIPGYNEEGLMPYYKSILKDL